LLGAEKYNQPIKIAPINPTPMSEFLSIYPKKLSRKSNEICRLKSES
jgi:hypothetical protein